MKRRSVAVAAVLLCGGMAWAQVCPQPAAGGATCLVPPSTASTPIYLSSTAGVATTNVVTTPSTAYTVPGSMISTATTCGNVSPETACVVNELRAVRGQIFASALQLRGQALVDRLNMLTMQEMTFRQQLASNPNMPGAQAEASSLTAQATALNQDIAAYNRELSMVPTDIRPYVATQINTFDVVYWQPSMQQFATYRTQFQTSGPATYQPAVVANPWLTQWQTNYQTSLNNIGSTQQTIASVRWWGSPQVLGTTETLPAGSTISPTGTMMMLPNGAAIYFPPGTVLMGTGTTMSSAACAPGTTSSAVSPQVSTATYAAGAGPAYCPPVQ